MIGWRPPTTWPCYCRRAPVCCTRWESCARTAFRRHRCTTYFAPLSFPGSSMRRQRGRECVRQLIMCALTRFCVAANASTVVVTTCRPSLIWRNLLTMIFFQASKSIPFTNYSLIYLTSSIYVTNFEPAHTTKPLSLKQNCVIVLISSYVCCTNTTIRLSTQSVLHVEPNLITIVCGSMPIPIAMIPELNSALCT